MDLVFTCPNCRQELEVDSSGAGTEIDCPECGSPITIPEPTPHNIRATPLSSTAGGQLEKHFRVPVSKKPVTVQIAKPLPPLEVQAKTGERRLTIKCIRRADCVEGGQDKFESKVAQFLQAIGDAHVVSILPIAYSTLDPASKQPLADYGVMIVYKG
jgi:DNA-directed RNA polymerase subunit RPC12/RpoP